MTSGVFSNKFIFKLKQGLKIVVINKLDKTEGAKLDETF